MKTSSKVLISLGAIAGAIGATVPTATDAIARTVHKTAIQVACDNPVMREVNRVALKYGLRPQYLRAVVYVESTCGWNIVKREQSRDWHNQIIKHRLAKPGTDRYNRMMSSWGPGHLSGVYSHLRYGIEPGYETLADDSLNLELLAQQHAEHKIRCKEKFKTKTLAQTEACMAAIQNGGPNGPKRKNAQIYAEKVTKHIGLV